MHDFVIHPLLLVDDEMMTQIQCNTSPNIDSNINSNIISTTSDASPNSNRYTQSPLNQLSNTIHGHAIAQPYSGESSNFGPFYHHHHHHHPNHMPSYGNPYDKFKIPANIHSRSPNTSSYGGYQGFYSTTSHHHQMVRPNGYIDLVPR